MNMSDRREGRAITCSRITNPITPVQGCIGHNHTRFEDGKKLDKDEEKRITERINILESDEVYYP